MKSDSLKHKDKIQHFRDMKIKADEIMSLVYEGLLK